MVQYIMSVCVNTIWPIQLSRDSQHRWNFISNISDSPWRGVLDGVQTDTCEDREFI